MHATFSASAALLALVLASAVQAQTLEAPYEGKLVRLSEILGSLHFLRNLCGESGSAWRDEMERLLSIENPDPTRRARLVAGFNHGYRSFEGVYTSCTESAATAIKRYMDEGETLTRELTSRYGN